MAAFDYGVDVAKVKHQAVRLASHSWEYGTCAQAILELDSPALSVFSPHAFPDGSIPQPSLETESLAYAKKHIAVHGDTLAPDQWAVGDPASLGVSAVLIATAKGDDAQSRNYLAAAVRQADFLRAAARWDNGAITHRRNVTELWADFIYMAPPFLAYLAIATRDNRMLEDAVDQCMLYRDVLVSKADDNTKGLWQHIAGPEKPDPGFWSTSNGWAAAGMCRVLATVRHCSWANDSPLGKSLQARLVSSLRELIDGAIAVDAHSTIEELLPNYLGDSSWFKEVSGTALLASVVFRMAVLTPDCFSKRELDWAEAKRQAVIRCVDPSTGIARPAVQPLDHGLREPLMTGSPEGQSFILLLSAAYRDWSTSANQIP